MNYLQYHSEIRKTLVASLAGLMVLILLAISGCQTALQSFGAIPGAPTEAAAISAPVEPESQPVVTISEVQGKLVPRHSASLSLAEGARVNQVYVTEGQTVSAGDLLLQLDGYEQSQAQLINAQAEELIAQQALDELYRNSEIARAKAGIELAEAEKEHALAEDHYRSMSTPLSKMTIEAGRVNMLLAERQLKDKQDGLAKAQRIFNNKKHIIWRFINKRQFRLRITLIEQKVAEYERRYQDAKENYEDLLAFPDPIDLELAKARFERANSRLDEAKRNLNDLSQGPDPDDLKSAQSRLKSAQANLEAAKVALESTQLVAPIDGEVVDLQADQGEWLSPGMPAVVIADLSEWQVESDEVGESIAPNVSPGQAVRLQVPAFPDLSLDGHVESLSQGYSEEDGDIFYTIKIIPMQSDPRLRWGMTVNIDLPQSSSAN